LALLLVLKRRTVIELVFPGAGGDVLLQNARDDRRKVGENPPRNKLAEYLDQKFNLKKYLEVKLLFLISKNDRKNTRLFDLFLTFFQISVSLN